MTEVVESIDKPEIIVVDSSAIIHHQKLYNVANKIVTIPEVLDELKCQRSRLTITLMPEDVHIISPSEQNIQFVKNFAQRTGDLRSLSLVDIKVLAAVVEMELIHCDKTHLRKNPIIPQAVDTTNDASDNAQPKAIIPGFYNSKIPNSGGDSDTWITPENIHQLGTDMASNGGSSQTNASIQHKVVCAVADYAMQNVLLHMGLRIVSVDGYCISQIRSYTMKCTTCYKIEPNVMKEFCDNCGYRTLTKLAYTLSSNGSVLCQQKLRAPKKEDASKFASIKAIATHGTPIRTEEQLNKMRNMHRTKSSHKNHPGGTFNDLDSCLSFLNRDTTSRSFQKGYHLRKNNRF